MDIPTILIVDDEPDNFDVIETLLPKQAYTLHYVSSGLEAIASLDIFCPDLLLLDVMMPDLDGIEVCRRIRANAQWESLGILMVTTLNTKEDLARCLQVGADDFISKPVDGLELRARVHSMLRIKHQYNKIQAFSKLQKDTIQLLQNNLEELRGTVASSLPHEFNTPLNGVLGSLKILRQHLNDMEPERIRRFLNLSYQSACRLENLTQQFLNYLHLELVQREQGSDRPSPAEVPSGGTPASSIEAIAHQRTQQAHRQEDCVCQIDEAQLAVSPEHLQWIVHELLDNACKFSAAGTLITVTGTYQAGWFHLSVQDRGRGMTQEQIASIGAFMQFERPIYEQQGAGLGLRIVQKVAELYGGRMLISSTYRQETTVHLTLPLQHSTQQYRQRQPNDAETLVVQYNTDIKKTDI